MTGRASHFPKSFYNTSNTFAGHFAFFSNYNASMARS
jgi:hypothetical protein